MEEEMRYAEALEQGCVRSLLIWMCIVEQGVVMKCLVLMFVLWMSDVELMRLLACERCVALCWSGVNACRWVNERGDANNVSECLLLLVAACGLLVWG